MPKKNQLAWKIAELAFDNVKLNKKCIELHPNIFSMEFLFEKDMREYTLKVLPLLQEGIIKPK